MIRKKQQNWSRKNRIQANHYIRFPEVRVLDEYGEMVGIMPTSQAQQEARQQGKDLVLITEHAKPPVVKIIDLAKFKYQQQQKAAESRKKAKKQDLKEVRFTPFMGEGDFESRLKKVIDFLEKGDKVRLSLQFKGRAITKKEFGFEIFNRVINQTQDIASVELEPKMLGKKLMAQLMPSKSKKDQDEKI